ncbi:MAG TPA: DMT family transporter [Geobacteraceae bacterium]|nr:DMT family transporter [Geobacteraceae bacterium]
MNSQKPATVSPLKVHVYLILTTVFWGGSFIFNKLGFRDLPPVAFFALRFTLATLLMACVCLPRLRQMTRAIVRRGFVVGLALAATNLSFVIGLSGTTATRAGFLNNLFVLFIPLICFLLWRDRVDRWSMAGILLALAGIWQLAQGGPGGFSRGDLLSTVCALFIAVHIITVSRVLRDDDVYLVSLVQFATVAVAGLLVFLLFPQPPLRFGPVSSLSLVYCAIFPTVVCFTLQNTWQRHTTPTHAGLVYTLDPVWSMLGGYLVLGERMNTREWLGCLLIFAAVLVPLAVRQLRENRLRRFYRQGSN